MATYTLVTDTETGHKKPVTTSLLRRLRDNPLAIAEGDPTAPKISPKALDLYLGAIDVTDTTASGLTGLDGMDAILIFASANFAGSSRIQFSLSDDGGSTWGAWFDNILFSASGAGYVNSVMVISLKSARLFRVTAPAAATNSGRSTSYTIPGSGANAIRFRFISGGGNTAQMEIFGIGAFA